MCTFISVFVPKSTALETIAQVADAHGLAFRPQENESVVRQLSAGDGLFLTTNGHCDCGTLLGSENRLKRTRRQSPEAVARRLRAKGWTEAKIARSLAQSEEHQIERRDAAQSGAQNELARWRDFLLAATVRGHVPYVGVLVHDYTGPLSEDIQLKARERIMLGSISTELLAKLERDVPYEFRAQVQ